jgi:hypothetical protein
MKYFQYYLLRGCHFEFIEKVAWLNNVILASHVSQLFSQRLTARNDNPCIDKYF